MCRGSVRHGFRIAVDHDGFIRRASSQGEGGMTAAIIKLNPLADPVRPAAQDHDLFAIRWVRPHIRAPLVRRRHRSARFHRSNTYRAWWRFGIRRRKLSMRLEHRALHAQLAERFWCAHHRSRWPPTALPDRASEKPIRFEFSRNVAASDGRPLARIPILLARTISFNLFAGTRDRTFDAAHGLSATRQAVAEGFGAQDQAIRFQA